LIEHFQKLGFDIFGSGSNESDTGETIGEIRSIRMNKDANVILRVCRPVTVLGILY
jgi:hypothetical protein